MAYWTRAKNGTVKGWESDKTAIKRATLRHLDNLSDEAVDAYFQNLNASKVSRKLNPEVLLEKTRDSIEKFLSWLSGRGRSRHTISQHRTNLQTAALFFDHLGPIAQWPRHSVKLRVHLKDQDFSENHINKIQMSVGQFWKYLRKHERSVEGLIDFDDTIGHAKSKTTPLKRHMTPDEVLAWVESCPALELKFMALLGYFSSLRPQEVFAMTAKDFIGGHEARQLECSKVMTQIKMFPGFVVDIIKQRGVKLNEIGDPKKHSVGMVSVFDKRAALLLVALLKEHGKDTLFPKGNRYYERLWKDKGISDVTPKDLRRASGYWLANYTSMKLEQLHLHMRHKDVQTTSLYFRRAKEQPKNRVLDIIEDEYDDQGSDTATTGNKETPRRSS